MPFTIRPYRRFPVQFSVSYSAGPFNGQGTVWNLSLTGWRLSGDLPMRAGETLSLSVTLPNQQRINVSEATVRWSRGNEFAVETNQIDAHAKARLQHFVRRLVGVKINVGILCIVLLTATLPTTLLAGYSSMCGSYASDLERAAGSYESAESRYGRAKSDFESACGSFGYSKTDESACGQFGYIREDYRSAATRLKSATSELQSAMSNVSSSCGVPGEESMYMRALAKAANDNEELKKRVLKLEQELAQYRQGPKGAEGLPPPTQ